MAEEKKIGEIAHYFGKISVAAIKLTGDLKVGDMIHIKGHTTDLEEKVESIQIQHDSVQKAGKGDDVGIKVKDHVRTGDEVFLKT